MRPSFDLLLKAQHAELPATQRMVYIAICSYASDSLTAYPSARRIAAQTGLHERTVKRAIKALCESGWLSILRHGGTDGRESNLYQITFIQARDYSDLKKESTPVEHENTRGDTRPPVAQDHPRGGTGSSRGDTRPPELPSELPNELPNPPLPPQGGKRDLPNWFDRYADRLWKTYPKKRDKKQSIAQLRKLIAKKNSRSVLAELLNYVRLRSRIEPDGQFWPTLDRMIRQEKFRDEIPGLGMAPNRIVDLYHKVLPQHPPCTGFSRRRLENLGSLWEKLGRSERRFGDYFEYCTGLPGLTGQVPSGWMADFGFLTNPDNFREICEGEKYRDRTAA